MPEQTPPAPDAEDARRPLRAELEKLAKPELLERAVHLAAALAHADERAERERAERERLHDALTERRRARPEDAMVVSALLDLHRATLHANRPDAARFLDAALKVGAPLADAILAAE